MIFLVGRSFGEVCSLLNRTRMHWHYSISLPLSCPQVPEGREVVDNCLTFGTYSINGREEGESHYLRIRKPMFWSLL